MTNPITNTTIAVAQRMPDDMWVQIFQHLEPADLCSFAQVCQLFHTIMGRDAVWAPFPEDVQRERRFHLVSKKEWRQEGTACIEKRIIEFIDRNPIPGKVSHLEITFANAPGAKISFWMGEGIKPKFGNKRYVFADRGQIVCSPEELLEERVVVFGNELQAVINSDLAYVSCPTPNGEKSVHHNYCGDTEYFNRRYDRRYNNALTQFLYQHTGLSPIDSLPIRWFWMNHYQVFGWSFKQRVLIPGPSDRIWQVASDRIYALDCEPMNAAKNRLMLFATAALAIAVSPATIQNALQAAVEVTAIPAIAGYFFGNNQDEGDQQH